MSGFDVNALVRDYGDAEEEARACRGACALFDFSFMSRARIGGGGAVETLARLQPRPMGDLAPGRIRYAVRLGAAGAVVADLTVWSLGGGVFEVMSGRGRDIADLVSIRGPSAWCEDLSAETAIFAIQGPGTVAALSGLADTDGLARLPYFTHDRFRIAGIDCRVGRLGYTGEKGFEIVVDTTRGGDLWRILAGRARPAGFAAIDLLRIEAGFILFANECGFGATAVELGLSDFAGAGTGRARVRLVSFTAEAPVHPVLWRPRPGGTLPRRRGEIAVTSAGHSIVAGKTLGLGFVSVDHDCDIAEDPEGWFRGVRLTTRPHFDPAKRRPRAPWESPSG